MKKIIIAFLVIGLLMALTGGILAFCPEDCDCPAAPAIATEILNEAGIRGAGRYISQIGQHMGPGTDFDGIGKCDREEYYEVVYNYLVELGVIINWEGRWNTEWYPDHFLETFFGGLKEIEFTQNGNYVSGVEIPRTSEIYYPGYAWFEGEIVNGILKGTWGHTWFTTVAFLGKFEIYLVHETRSFEGERTYILNPWDPGSAYISDPWIGQKQ